MSDKKFINQLTKSIIFLVYWLFVTHLATFFITHSDWVTYGGEVEALLAAVIQSVCYVFGFIPVTILLIKRRKQIKIGLAFSFARNFILARTLDGNGKINFVGYGAICTLMVVVISSFLFANSGYNNYSECILDKIPGTSNNQAANDIRRACKELTQ